MSVAEPKNDMDDGKLPQHDAIEHAVLAVRLKRHAHPAQAHHMELRIQRAAPKPVRDGAIERPHDEDQCQCPEPCGVEIIGHGSRSSAVHFLDLRHLDAGRAFQRVVQAEGRVAINTGAPSRSLAMESGCRRRTASSFFASSQEIQRITSNRVVSKSTGTPYSLSSRSASTSSCKRADHADDGGRSVDRQ